MRVHQRVKQYTVQDAISHGDAYGTVCATHFFERRFLSASPRPPQASLYSLKLIPGTKIVCSLHLWYVNTVFNMTDASTENVSVDVSSRISAIRGAVHDSGNLCYFSFKRTPNLSPKEKQAEIKSMLLSFSSPHARHALAHVLRAPHVHDAYLMTRALVKNIRFVKWSSSLWCRVVLTLMISTYSRRGPVGRRRLRCPPRPGRADGASEHGRAERTDGDGRRRRVVALTGREGSQHAPTYVRKY